MSREKRGLSEGDGGSIDIKGDIGGSYRREGGRGPRESEIRGVERAMDPPKFHCPVVVRWGKGVLPLGSCL